MTSTVTFLERSPLATAVVTSAMFRTWPVRFEAMPFTESVRSFQVPETPLTFAWPPSLPSVPTSRATRVTSSAKEESWLTIAFTVVPIRRNSPRTGWPPICSWILWLRSPSATASITRATSIVGRARLSISSLTAPTFSAHDPGATATSARSLIRPSRPTTLLTRTNSLVTRWLRSTSVLNAAAASARAPSPRSRTEKSPSLAAWSAATSFASSAAVGGRPPFPESATTGLRLRCWRGPVDGAGGTRSSFADADGCGGSSTPSRALLYPQTADV